ncbi:hypothetical protein ACFYTC_17370 [Actinomadura nitritigenes]|uniref:hypothetical protein n=1 Tax=Actinomadura nitritigenes TaxID=134602 RepID=UPI0036B92B14
MSALDIRLRPVTEDDLAMFRRFATEPGLIGLDWTGFRGAQAPARRYASDGYLGEDEGRLIVEADGTAAPLEGVLRAVEFRAGRWRDGWMYSRLRNDPPPPSRP